MLPEPDRRQLRHEAAWIQRNARPENTPDAFRILPDEIIEHQARELYKSPHFLPKTATPQQVAELDDILAELWAVNEDHAGENTFEVEVYYSLTGETSHLAQRAKTWCHSYFEARSDVGRLSPQDGNDPFEMYKRLLKEFDDILGRQIIRPRSVNYFFLQLAMRYVPWLLYQRLWKRLILPMGSSFQLRYKPVDPTTPQWMAQSLRWGGWLTDSVAELLGLLRSCTDSARWREFDKEPDMALRAKLACMAADIQEMRRLLVKGFNPRKTVIVFGKDLAVAWWWSVRFGIGNLCIATPAANIIRRLESSHSDVRVAVDFDGLLIGGETPWLKADALGLVDGIRPLVLNCYLVELFHKRLFSFYDQIDFGRIRCGAKEGRVGEFSEEEVFDVSCHDLAASEPEETEDLGGDMAPPPAVWRPIRAVRSRRLLTLLSESFDCQVRQGKGSEITVYRTGGKKCILSHHKRNSPVPSPVIGRLLKRLGIGLQQWLAIVYR